MRILTLFSILMSCAGAGAADYANELGAFFLDPHVAVGTNSNQGTTALIGADAGFILSPQISAGLGVYGAIGERGSRDREVGGGPFVRFAQPLGEFLIFSVREDLDYVDQRRPLGDSYRTYTGAVSFTTVGLHVSLSRAIGVSFGYRASIGLNQTDLGHGRSMPYFGFSLGI